MSAIRSSVSIPLCSNKHVVSSLGDAILIHMACDAMRSPGV